MGSVRLYGSTSGYLELQAPAVAPDAVLTLPSDSVQPGLVHLHTETFSAVSSLSINNVFSVDYDAYRIIVRGLSTSNSDAQIRLRSGGTDATGASDYLYQLLSVTGTSVSSASTTTNLWVVGVDGSTAYSLVMDIFSPATSEPTTFLSASHRGGARIQSSGGVHTPSTAFDGFTYFDNVGSVTGTLRVYGYRNA